MNITNNITNRNNNKFSYNNIDIKYNIINTSMGTSYNNWRSTTEEVHTDTYRYIQVEEKRSTFLSDDSFVGFRDQEVVDQICHNLLTHNLVPAADVRHK